MCATGATGLESFRYFEDFVEGRRGEILDAALAVFGEKGYEAGTMREIAARVGVSEPAIYRHYQSKEAILADIVATAGDRITAYMSDGLGTITGANVRTSRLEQLQKRRAGAAMKRAVRAQAAAEGRSTVMAAAEKSGPGGVLHILFHAAPHNEHFVSLMRQHLSGPMMKTIREFIPRIDADFGIERTREEREARLRVFMSLFVGYFTTSLFFDAPPNDDAIVEAMLAIMGWESAEETG
jgi:AcrR family transcriptional regulator